jgi:hypothetical protein
MPPGNLRTSLRAGTTISRATGLSEFTGATP